MFFCFPPESYICSSETFHCKDSKCVPSVLVCDGVPSCLDGSDEDPEKCGKIKAASNIRGW